MTVRNDTFIGYHKKLLHSANKQAENQLEAHLVSLWFKRKNKNEKPPSPASGSTMEMYSLENGFVLQHKILCE